MKTNASKMFACNHLKWPNIARWNFYGKCFSNFPLSEPGVYGKCVATANMEKLARQKGKSMSTFSNFPLSEPGDM